MNHENKYQLGDFGYWWTVEMGNEDVEGKEYNGDITCSHSNLTSLKGAPEKVRGFFNCSGFNKLISLEGAPREVGGNFDCNFCADIYTYSKRRRKNCWCK